MLLLFVAQQERQSMINYEINNLDVARKIKAKQEAVTHETKAD